MKNLIKQTAVVLVAGMTLAVGVTRTQGQAPTAVSYGWGFASSTNPAAPDSPGLAAQAVVAPGGSSDGWIASDAILGAAQGIWDLGIAGTITLTNNPNGFGGGSGPAQLITVNVTQFQGGVYSQEAQISVPGAEFVSRKDEVVSALVMGDWVSQETQWRAAAGVAVNSIVITAPATRLLVDGVVVTTSAATAVQPPTLSIRRVGPDGSQVEISWPASYTGMVLQSTAVLNDPNGWTPVAEAVQTTGDTSSVTMGATVGARFYRLKQP